MYAGIGVAAGILLLAAPLMHVLAIFAGLFFLVVIAARPEVGILIMLVLLSSIVFEESLPLIPIGIGSFHVSDVILLFMLGAVIFKVFVRRACTYVRTSLDLPLALFIVTVAASTCISLAQGQYGKDLALVLRLFRDVTYYLIVIVITNLIRNVKQIRFLIHGLFAIAAVVAATMLVQAIVGDSVQLMPGRVEAAETFDQQYDALRLLPPGQILLLVSLITSICMVAFENRRSLLFSRYPYLVALLGVGLLLTYTRNYWIALLLAVCLLFLLRIGIEGKKRLLVLLAVVTILAVLFIGLFSGSGGKIDKAFDAISVRYGSLFAPKKLNRDSSLGDRYIENGYAIKQIEDHPVLGIGLGNDYRPELPGMREGLTYYIHNSYLYIMTDTGLTGFCFFFWFYIVFLVRAMKHWKQIQDKFLKSALLGFMISGIVILPSALVIPIFMEWFSLVVIAVMIGLSEAIIRTGEAEMGHVKVIRRCSGVDLKGYRRRTISI